MLDSVFTSVRNWSLGKASQNVVLGELMRNKLLEEGVHRSAISVIPNWADGEAICPLRPSNNELRRQWGLLGKLVVGYSGNMGRAHEFDTVLGAMESLADHDAVSFLFVGGGAKLEELRAEARRRELKNAIFLPYQPREKLGLSLTVPDVHLISLKPDLEGLIVPSKFYGIAAAGRPTIHIGDPGGEIPRLLKEHGCGMAVQSGNVHELVLLIRRLEHSRDEVRKMGDRARAMFDRCFAKPRAMESWFRLLNNVQSKGGG
jgi:glycosyltransferase involved in cell wall biosynthesis